MKLADELGFHIAWFVEHHFREGRSHCPAPEVVIGALTQATENIRLGLRRDAAALRVHPPGARRREGGDRRHPLAGSHRVGHGPLDADGADRVPRRPRSEPRRVGGGDRDHLRDVARGVLRVGQPHVPVPAPAHHPEAVPGPAPAVLDGGDLRRLVGRRRVRTSSGLLSFSIMQPLDKMAAQIQRVPRRVEQPRREADLRRRHQQGRGVHAGALRGDRAAGRATTASGTRSRGGTRTSPQFTLDWELPHLDPKAEQDARSRS